MLEPASNDPTYLQQGGDEEPREKEQQERSRVGAQFTVPLALEEIQAGRGADDLMTLGGTRLLGKTRQVASIRRAGILLLCGDAM